MKTKAIQKMIQNNYSIILTPKVDKSGSVYWTAMCLAFDGAVGGGPTPDDALIELIKSIDILLEYEEENHV